MSGGVYDQDIGRGDNINSEGGSDSRVSTAFTLHVVSPGLIPGTATWFPEHCQE